ncbi:MAG: hypothetical protein KC441_00525 [Anaerolineales bacterium]|mgnify:CR=1 FL=1|nr:hypothetical protein [Anaerolineales bacterium]
MDVKQLSPQKLNIGDVLDIEFVGDGRRLPISVKRAIISGLVASAEQHMTDETDGTEGE